MRVGTEFPGEVTAGVKAPEAEAAGHLGGPGIFWLSGRLSWASDQKTQAGARSRSHVHVSVLLQALARALWVTITFTGGWPLGKASWTKEGIKRKTYVQYPAQHSRNIMPVVEV